MSLIFQIPIIFVTVCVIALTVTAILVVAVLLDELRK